MKRLRNDDENPIVARRMPKLITQQLPSSEELFASLPYELVMHILRYISREDLISLATTSKKIRRALQPYVFACVKVSWNDLTTNWKSHNTPIIITKPFVIERLRLMDHCSQNEWTFPFADLFSSNKLPHLHSFSLPTSGSTSFLKYSSTGSCLKKLSIHTVRSGSIFNMEHISPFSELTHLKLVNFEIESFDENRSWCPKLSNLSLENCTWCYPFKLENFGHEKISSLDLKYSNAFIISERFKMFLNSPNFTNLCHLSITNNERNLKLTLSVHIMNLIESIPTLKRVELNGNIYNETVHELSRSCQTYLALNNVKIFYSSFLHAC